MRIEVFFTPSQVDELFLREKNVIVIDVLRASTTIITALKNGAKEIIPVSTVESAVKVSGNLFGDVVLRGGERNGRIIEGFNLGNSPAEYSEEAVKGKSIIFCTTNGSSAMVKARDAKNMAVAGFPNISTVVNFIREMNEDFNIICAGKQSFFCIEDAVCAGMIIKKLTDIDSLDLEFNDSAIAAQTLYKSASKSLIKMAKTSDHGKYLTEIGMGDDLKLCTDVDTFNVLPQLIGNVIKLKKKDEQKQGITIMIDTSAEQGA